MISSFVLPAVLALTLPVTSPKNTNTPILYPTQISDAATAHDREPAVCYKMRTYIFERNDGDAPKFVRETSCGPERPRMNRSKTPKARLIPAN